MIIILVYKNAVCWYWCVATNIVVRWLDENPVLTLKNINGIGNGYIDQYLKSEITLTNIKEI